MNQNSPQPDSGYQVNWYRKDDIALLQYFGFITDELLKASLDELHHLLDEAGGDLVIYFISDQTKMTGYTSNFMTLVALHPVAFHPKGAKLYVVGSHGELMGMYLGFSQHRHNLVRFADSLEEAVREIDVRRSAHFARQNKELKS